MQDEAIIVGLDVPTNDPVKVPWDEIRSLLIEPE